MARAHGHPIAGAVAGFFAFTFLGTTLLFLGVLPLDSTWLGILPLVGIPLGAAWGWWAPLGRRPRAAAPDRVEPTPEPPPPPAALVEPRPPASV